MVFVFQELIITNMITILISNTAEVSQNARCLLSDLVRKHLYANHRDCGMQAVARLFTSWGPSRGGGPRDSLLSLDQMARLSAQTANLIAAWAHATEIVEGEKCRPCKVKDEGELSLPATTIQQRPEGGTSNPRSLPMRRSSLKGDI